MDKLPPEFLNDVIDDMIRQRTHWKQELTQALESGNAERALELMMKLTGVTAVEKPVLSCIPGELIVWMSNAGGECTYVSEAWYRLTGHRTGQDLGSAWALSIHPEDRGRVETIYRHAFDARLPFENKYRLRCGDGQYRWIHSQGTPEFSMNGDPEKGDFLGYLGIACEMTELPTIFTNNLKMSQSVKHAHVAWEIVQKEK